MRRLYIIFYLVLGSIFVLKSLVHASDDIFANMTYVIGDEYRSQKVTLINGKYMLSLVYGGQVLAAQFPHIYVWEIPALTNKVYGEE
jgi:hypothetical protein